MARGPDSRDRREWPPNLDEGLHPDSRELQDHEKCLHNIHEGERTFQEDVKTCQFTLITTQSCSRSSSGTRRTTRHDMWTCQSVQGTIASSANARFVAKIIGSGTVGCTRRCMSLTAGN